MMNTKVSLAVSAAMLVARLAVGQSTVPATQPTDPGFPTSYVENDAWGHNAYVYPWEFVLSVLIWSGVACAALVPLRRYLSNVYEAVSVTNSATRWAIILELLAVHWCS